jgi:hypothetical protein
MGRSRKIGLTSITSGDGSFLPPRWREADSNPRSLRQKDLCKRSRAIASTGGAQLNPGVRFFGHWLEYNEPAARDAKQKLRAFLAANLDGAAAGQSQTPP